MLYTDLQFYIEQLSKKKAEEQRSKLIAASFTAWQILRIRDGLKLEWEDYVAKLGLSKRIKLTKEDLKREEQKAKANVQRILKKAKVKNE